jgi:integration host factor subunit beta
MTSSQLAAAMAKRYPQLSPWVTYLSAKVILDAMADALTKGNRIEFRGFGSFALNYRAPRKGRNPSTGKPVSVPAKLVPHFKPAKKLRELVDW